MTKRNPDISVLWFLFAVSTVWFEMRSRTKSFGRRSWEKPSTMKIMVVFLGVTWLLLLGLRVMHGIAAAAAAATAACDSPSCHI